MISCRVTSNRYAELIKNLASRQSVDFRTRGKLTTMDLECHVCHEPVKNMPALKKHIAAHF
jgi:hypothetical protein